MLELLKTRNRDFVARCRHIAADTDLTQRQIVERVIAEGAPSYYVTFDYAYRRLRQWRSGRLPASTSAVRLQQWQEIASRIDEKKCRNPALTDYSALCHVLTSCKASRYFITPGYGLRLLHRLGAISPHRRCRRRHTK